MKQLPNQMDVDDVDGARQAMAYSEDLACHKTRITWERQMQDAAPGLPPKVAHTHGVQLVVPLVPHGSEPLNTLIRQHNGMHDISIPCPLCHDQ